MDIAITRAAAEEGVLRIWLRRILEQSNVVYAFRTGQGQDKDEPVGEAAIYGRGIGSAASERAMLMFRLSRARGDAPFREGEILKLKARNADGDGYDDIDLDLLQVE
jgi:hypothetical protein